MFCEIFCIFVKWIEITYSALIIKNMKKRYLLWTLTVCLLLFTMSASAQKGVGMRVEVAESETDNGDYSIFTYRFDNDSIGYYMSLARTSKFLGADAILGMQVKNVKETVVWLGSNTDEAFATIDNIMVLYDKDVDDTTEFQGCATSGSGGMGESVTVKCKVVKKPLGGKRLEFLFDSGDGQAHVYLPKSVVKELRMNFKLDVKLHPKQHKKK